MDIGAVTSFVEAISFVVFVALLTLASMRMILRVLAYQWTGKTPSVILKRDLALMGAFLFVVGAPVVVSFFGWGELFFEGGVHRLWYVSVRNGVAILALAYWVWVEYFVIGREGREND